METFLHLAGLAQLPAFGLLVYIAYMVGRHAQRVAGLENRMTRVENRLDTLIGEEH